MVLTICWSEKIKKKYGTNKKKILSIKIVKKINKKIKKKKISEKINGKKKNKLSRFCQDIKNGNQIIIIILITKIRLIFINFLNLFILWISNDDSKIFVKKCLYSRIAFFFILFFINLIIKSIKDFCKLILNDFASLPNNKLFFIEFIFIDLINNLGFILFIVDIKNKKIKILFKIKNNDIIKKKFNQKNKEKLQINKLSKKKKKILQIKFK